MAAAAWLVAAALALAAAQGRAAIVGGPPMKAGVAGPRGADIATLLRNRNLQVALPRGFAVNNDPPDSGTVLQALLSANGGGGLGHENLEVAWATRRQAEVSVVPGTPGYFGSVSVYY